MKPIFPINLCKLTDKLFTEFKNADLIDITSHKDYLTVVIKSLGRKIAIIHLREETLLTDVIADVEYSAWKVSDKIHYIVGTKEAVSELELEKSMEKLREIVHRRNETGIILLDIEKELMEPLKVLDSVF
jgi:hypothetical protein